MEPKIRALKIFTLRYTALRECLLKFKDDLGTAEGFIIGKPNSLSLMKTTYSFLPFSNILKFF